MTRVVRRFIAHRAAVFGGCILAGMIFLGVWGPLASPHDPIAANLSDRLLPPSLKHPFGTDSLGRDVLSRLLSGSRIAFEVGSVSVAIAGSVGTVLGLISGFYGRAVDGVLMGFVDVLLAFPYLLLALLVVTALGPGLTNAMIAIGIVYIPQYARVVRGTVLSVKEKDYVLAAQAVGASNKRLMLRHVLANSLAPIIVQSSLSFGFAIISAATLSFLGLGAQPPTPEWGAMLSEGRDYMRNAPWLTTFPGLAILVTVIGWNLLGDGLRDALDPRQKIRALSKDS